MSKAEIGALVIALIKSELNGLPLSSDVKDKLTPEILPSVYTLSKMHDLAHVVGDALLKNGVEVPADIKAKFLKQQSLAVFRYERIKFELEELCAFFDQKGIPYMPLKGSVIRKYYPRPEMRTSCDIDILVKKKDVDKAVDLLVKEKGYKRDSKNSHDVSTFSPSGVHVEMHYGFMDETRSVAEKVLAETWKINEPYGNFSVGKQMTSEYLITYLTVHGAKHFLVGGCGIRTLMDIYLIEEQVEYDKGKLDVLLSRCDVKRFYEKITALSKYWFGDGEKREDILKIQDYIFNGGVYGSLDNSVSIKASKQKSKFGFVLSRLFLPYREMLYVYPILEKAPVLYPFMVVGRWFKLLSPKKREKVRREMEISNMSDEEKQNKRKFLEEVGL